MISPAMLGQSPTFVAAGIQPAKFWFHETLFLPYWSGVGLVGTENAPRSADPVVFLIAADGTREDVKLSLPEGSLVSIRHAAAGSDGAVAAIDSYLASDWSNETFLVWVSPDRKRQTLARLYPYVPVKVAIASTGVIWTAGWIVAASGHVADHDIMRRFNTDCEALGSFLPYKGDSPGLHPTNYSFLVASSDRVVWYCPIRFGYLEFSLDGRLVDRAPGVQYSAGAYNISGVAVSPDDTAFVSRWNPELRRSELLLLNRARRAWLPFHLPDESQLQQPRASGFHGEELVITTPATRMWNLRFYKPPKPEEGGLRP